MMHVRGFCVSAILSALVIALGCAPAGPEGAGSGQVLMEGDGPPVYPPVPIIRETTSPVR